MNSSLLPPVHGGSRCSFTWLLESLSHHSPFNRSSFSMIRIRLCSVPSTFPSRFLVRCSFQALGSTPPPPGGGAPPPSITVILRLVPTLIAALPFRSPA